MNRVFPFQLPESHFTILISQTFPACVKMCGLRTEASRRHPSVAAAICRHRKSLERSGALLRGAAEAEVFGHLALL